MNMQEKTVHAGTSEGWAILDPSCPMLPWFMMQEHTKMFCLEGGQSRIERCIETLAVGIFVQQVML